MKTLRSINFIILFLGIISIVLLHSCCCNTYPNPEIKYDHKDADGRIYIPIMNRNVYPNSLFKEAPSLPPCGANTKSSRTWVDIYDAATDARIYGFCAFKTNEDLKTIWFKPSTYSGKVYVIINDRGCKKTYKSNTIEWGECLETYPNPQIKFDHRDAEGRIYIPVVNWEAYSNDLFRQASELPACGDNSNSARAWVDIYNAADNTRLYGFCAFSKNADLKEIWFSSKAKKGEVYITINDRACKKSYKSNTITWQR